MTAEPFALVLTPHGEIHVDAAPPDEGLLAPDLASQLRGAFGKGTRSGLLVLATVDPAVWLPPSVDYFRGLAHLFFTQLCAVPDLEARRMSVELPAPEAELSAFAERVPPMVGSEYATLKVLRRLWDELTAAVRSELNVFAGPVERYLHAKSPIWNTVGRVCFHLAENRADERKPFAFLATYATGVSSGGQVQHRPLGHALQEYAGAGQKAGLLALLLPVQRAAEHSPFVKELVDSGRVFQPQPFGVNEAHRFLQSIADCEAAGVVVRVPDWWKPKAPPRVGVQVTVGGEEPSKVGASALLDFKVGLAVDGEALTDSEWAALRKEQAGLVRLRGKWVEIDPAKLQQLLAHWEEAKKAHKNGIPFHESMRLLAGVSLGGESAAGEDSPVGARVIAGPWLREMLAALRQEEELNKAHPGKSLHATLRPYQEVGVRWLWYLNQLNLGGCLADDMGLGKTIQVLSMFLLLKQKERRPHLLVVPATLLGNWQAEAARFAPDVRLLVAHPSATAGASLSKGSPAELAAADVVMTTYGSVHRWEWLRAESWDTVVLDEAQAIKNGGARQTQAVKALKARARLALTGTPVENRISDLWSLFDFLNPGLLGSSQQLGRFLKKAKSQSAGTVALRDLVKPYLLRRLKTDRRIISDLPDKTEVRAFCPLTKAQAALYQEVVDDLSRQLKENKELQQKGIRRSGVVLATLMKLKQICNHPSHFTNDGGWSADKSGKIGRLSEIIEPIAGRQEKAIVFSQFRETTAPLANHLARMFGAPGLVLTGETPVKTRRELVERFQSDESVPFMVLTVKSGGTGLNLTAANHVIHFDRWWNPAVENQATDRAFRIGQKRNVLVHKLVCRGTVEERIDEIIESKKKLANELLEEGGEVNLAEMNNEELLRIVALDVTRAVAEA